MTTLAASSWPMRSWYKSWGGTCFGYGIMLAPDSDALAHEMVHVEQNEAGSIAGLILGISALVTMRSWWGLVPFFIFWIGTPWVAYFSSVIVAALRGEASAYRGSHLEEAAYDATRK